MPYFSLFQNSQIYNFIFAFLYFSLFLLQSGFCHHSAIRTDVTKFDVHISAFERTTLAQILLLREPYIPKLSDMSIWIFHSCPREKTMALHSSTLAWKNPMDRGAWWAAVHGVPQSRTQLSDFTFSFHFHALEKEMATHSSVLAWRIPGTGQPGGLPPMGSHRVGQD